MPLGSSLFLIAIGAILRYAISADVTGVSLPTIGLILMIVGAIGMLVSILYMLLWAPARRGDVVREHVIERDPRERPIRDY
jgi:Domain of unknown function (DUF6458)